MQPDPIMTLITKALERLPADVRDQYIGAAFVKFSELSPLIPEEARVDAVGRHIEYLYRKDRQAAQHPLPSDPVAPPAVDQVELADTLASLKPSHRAIVAMILAGHTQREAADATGTSPATVCRTIKGLIDRGAA